MSYEHANKLRKYIPTTNMERFVFSGSWFCEFTQYYKPKSGKRYTATKRNNKIDRKVEQKKKQRHGKQKKYSTVCTGFLNRCQQFSTTEKRFPSSVFRSLENLQMRVCVCKSCISAKQNKYKQLWRLYLLCTISVDFGIHTVTSQNKLKCM